MNPINRSAASERKRTNNPLSTWGVWAWVSMASVLAFRQGHAHPTHFFPKARAKAAVEAPTLTNWGSLLLWAGRALFSSR